MAGHAIEAYFKKQSCVSTIQIVKMIEGRRAIEHSDIELLKWARSGPNPVDSLILLRVEELGPLIILYPSPILWEGGSEVSLRVRVLNVRTSSLETDTSIQWKDTGAFVLRGTGPLERNLETVLTSVFGQSQLIEQFDPIGP